MVEVVDLIRDLGSPDTAKRIAAIDSIGQIGSRDPDGIVVAISPLVTNLAHENADIRRRTIDALINIAKAKPNLIKGAEPSIRKCLQDKDKTIRLRCVDALCTLHSPGFSSVPDVLPLLKHSLVDPNPDTFKRAMGIVKRVGQGDPELLEILDSIAEARDMIAEYEGGGQDFSKVVPVLNRSLNHLLEHDLDASRREAMESLKMLMGMNLGPVRPKQAPQTQAPEPHEDPSGTEPSDEAPRDGSGEDAVTPRSFIPKAEELLELARQAYERGDFSEVEKLTAQIESLATKTAREYYDDEVMKKIKNAEEFIADAQRAGADTAKAEGVLQNAREAMNNGYFEAAINYVNQTLAAVKEAKKASEAKKTVKKDDVAIEEGLADRFTFDTFVVGNNSRFVFAAAQAVAKRPAETYNPLFIYGGAGLGKTHLINAIGNEAKRLNPSIRIKYVSSEKITTDLIDAIKKGQVEEFRKLYRSVDILLIDDIHFLAGKESTQEEFFNTFNSLYNSGKQIVITSDRPPSSLQNLTDRIVSRLEGGLIADIQPPNLETKIAILESQAKEENLNINSDVLQYIAGKIKSNIRSLKGALKKVVAYSNVTENLITLSLVDEVFRTSIDERAESAAQAEAAQTAAAGAASAAKAAAASAEEEAAKAAAEDIKLDAAISYLVEEERPKYCFELFEKTLKGASRGLCITRSNPKLLEKRFDVTKAKILWLTDSSVNEPKIYPKLESMMYTLEEFIEKKEPGILLLDGIEYLISIHGFSPTLKFLREIIDDISMSQTTLLIPLNPAAIDKQDASMLEREMETISR